MASIELTGEVSRVRSNFVNGIKRFPVPSCRRAPAGQGRSHRSGCETTTTTRTIVREHEGELVVQNAELVAEDVVALTLVSPDGRDPAPVVARRPRRPHAGRRPRPAVLAVQLPRRRRRLAHRRPARPRTAAGVAAGARHPDRGRHRQRPRPAQPLPAGRRIALPVHRRRHRHHPDAADDRPGRGRRRRLAAALRRPHTARRWRFSPSWPTTATG